MITCTSLTRRSPRALCRPLCRKMATELSADEVADKCQAHVLSSPYDPILPGPYLPLCEFVSSQWTQDKTPSPRMDKTAIIDISTNMTRTFGEYRHTMGGLAASLRYDMGVKEGDCVALYCPNHVDYSPVSLAVTLTGAMLTPINPLFSAQELMQKLQSSRSTVLIVHVSKLDAALSALTQQKNDHKIEHVIVISDDGSDTALPEGTVDLNSLRNHDKAFFETISEVHSKTNQHPCLLPYSSGTTGTPKGVCLTHKNIVANLLQVDNIEGDFYKPDMLISSPLPFFHIYAFTVNLLYNAWKGNTLVTNSGRFDMEEYCKTVEQYKIGRAYLVPPIMLGLAKHPIVDKYDFSSLDTVLSAAAPAGKELETATEARLNVKVKQCWGMSELSPLGIGHRDDNVKHGSVGPLAASTFGKVVDEQGNSLGPNQSGELFIKGPQVMTGYLDEPEKTAETLSKSGWLRTGDVAMYDEDGFFYITDRIKELIKVRGFPVAPAELEALLLTHDAIADVAVTSVPNEGSGELPRAFIVLKPKLDEVVSEDDIKDWVKERVAPFKRLEGGVVFTDSIPKSASGKILRRMLQD